MPIFLKSFIRVTRKSLKELQLRKKVRGRSCFDTTQAKWVKCVFEIVSGFAYNAI